MDQAKNLVVAAKPETGAAQASTRSALINRGEVLTQRTTYSLAIDSLRITNTRSLHEDTDYVTASVTVGTNPPVTQTKSLGNLNNGTHAINISFDGISVAEGQVAVLTYAVVNSGHASQAEVESALTKAGTSLADKAAQAAAKVIGGAIGAELGSSIGTAAVPIVGTALGALAGWLVGELASLVFANCDGPVAAGVHVFTIADLTKGMTGSDYTPGVDSAHGCGSNSEYYVNWSVSAQHHPISAQHN